MKIAAAALLLAAVSLAACGGRGDDTLGDQVSDTAENRADTMEATADNLEEEAEAVRDNGEDQEEAIDDADVDAKALSNGQRGALVNSAVLSE